MGRRPPSVPFCDTCEACKWGDGNRILNEWSTTMANFTEYEFRTQPWFDPAWFDRAKF